MFCERIKAKVLGSAFVKGAIILSLGAIICKIIGAVYRVPLTNILGAEGMGLYQLVYPIFTLLLVVSSSGIPNAISRLISEKVALGQRAYAYKIIRVSAVMMLLIGVIFSLGMYLLADDFGVLQGNPMVDKAYKAIAPSILLVAMISVFRGVFQGMGNMSPTAVSQIIEQLIKLVFGLSFAYLLRGEGSEWAVAGALAGITLSEALSLVYLGVMYMRGRARFTIEDKDKYTPKSTHIAREILRIVCPMTLASIFMPIILVVDSVLLVNLLQASGESVSVATSNYGLYSGVANTIINMPVVVATALATALVPVICALLAKGDRASATLKINSTIDSVMIVGVPSFLGFVFFGGDIAQFLFPSVINASNYDTISMLMTAGALNVLLISLISISSAVLQCMNKLYVPALGMFVGCLVKVFVSITAVGTFGILAGSLASLVCYLVATCINVRALGAEVELSFDKAPIYLLASVVFVAVAYMLRFFLYDLLGALGTVVSIGLAGGVYLMLLWLFLLRSARNKA